MQRPSLRTSMRVFWSPHALYRSYAPWHNRPARPSGHRPRPPAKSPSMPDNTRLCWPLHHLSHQPQLRTILVEHRVIPDPGPLPAALGGRAFVMHMTLDGLKHLHPQAPQPLEPGAVRQRPEQARGPCLSQPRTRHNSEGVQQPKSAGNITPIILPRSLCWLRKRPSISATRSLGRPSSCKAWCRASAALCAWR